MIRYFITAALLKGFSCSSTATRAYRALGNTLGAKKRTKGELPQYYFNRVNNFLQLNRRYGLLKDGDKVMEIGTGWLHWDAILARLFFDINAVLLDVWDNRQLDGLHYAIKQLDTMLNELDADDAQRERAHSLIGKISRTKTFDELYDLLGFQYVLDSSGKFETVQRESVDLVVSSGVLEHIHVNILPDFMNSMATVLKDGGYSLHEINIRDHLYQYDMMASSSKQYLSYSNREWKRWFENDVQYFNRVQQSQWVDLFDAAGLKLIEADADSEDISRLKIARDYKHLDISDLQCVELRILHRKPDYLET